MPSRSFIILVMAAASLQAQSILPDSERTNGTGTLSSLAALQKLAASCTVQVGKTREQGLAGIFVSPDGYILTPASETAPLRPLHILLPDGTTAEAREAHREESLNLLLLKIERTGLPSIAWGSSLSLKAGQWLCALTQEGREIRLGVVSARARIIPDSGAVLGISFSAGGQDTDGVLIEAVAESGPAQKAGLQEDDLIVSLNEQPVHRASMVKEIVARHDVGDSVKVRYLRTGKPMECEVRLASKNQVMTNWTGEDFANHGISVRTDNFPMVLQHDLPLFPADMGGAIFDLQGQAVGLNIARVDRVTNYALPVETFVKKLEQWMKADRKTTAPVKSP